MTTEFTSIIAFVLLAVVPVQESHSAMPQRRKNSRNRTQNVEPLEARRLLTGVYPTNAGLIDVTDPQYAGGADGSDTDDDTAAIQAAMNAAGNNNRIVYLPAGTYYVSDTLQWQTPRRLILEGAGSDLTTIQLADGGTGEDASIGFDDPDSPKAVINTFFGGINGKGKGFRNSIRGLTIDVGMNNPGAMGITFNGNNQASIEDVTIRAAQPADPVNTPLHGLDLTNNGQIGPLYIEGLTVDGFQNGINATKTRSITAVDVTLTNQTVAGVRSNQGLWNFEGFTSINSVPAIEATGSQVIVNVLDAKITALPNSTGVIPSAIKADRGAYLRNVTVDGTQTIVESTNTNNFEDFTSDETTTTIEEWFAGGTRKLFDDSIDQPLNMERLPEPNVPLEPDLSKWSAPIPNPEDPNDTPGKMIQRAIDSGATTIFLPGGTEWVIGEEEEVVIRNGVERIIGMEARMQGKGRIVVADSAADTVVIERLDNSSRDDRLRIVNESDNTLVLSSIAGFNLREISPADSPGGDLFLTDVVGPGLEIHKPGQRVFARQLNIEENEINLHNSGADVFILGYKTEKRGTKILTENGGRTELIGGHILSNNPVNATEEPEKFNEVMFEVIDAQASFVGVRNLINSNGNPRANPPRPADTPYQNLVSETRNGITRTFTREVNSTNGFLPHFSATDGTVAAWTFESTGTDTTGFTNLDDSNATFVPGAIGEGVDFDAANSELASENIDQRLSQLDDFTVTGWLRTRKTSRGRGVFHIGEGEADFRDGAISIMVRGGQIELLADDLLGDTRFRSGVDIEDGSWHHFALTVQPGDRAEWYIDGSTEPTAVMTNLNDHQYSQLSNVLIGRSFYDGERSFRFDGQLDEIRVFDRALSGDAIRSRYLAEAELAPLATGCNHSGDGDTDALFARWAMDGSSDDLVGTLAADSTNLEFVSGVDGQAAQFSGDEHADFTSTGFGLCDFTISGWVQTTSNGRKGIINLRSGDSNDFQHGGLSVYMIGGRLKFEAADLIGNTRFSSGTLINDGQFHHFAVTVRANDRIEWYIDGNLTAVHHDVANFRYTRLDRGSIGSRFYDGQDRNRFVGQLDDLRIYDRAIVTTGVQSLATSPDSSLFDEDDEDWWLV